MSTTKVRMEISSDAAFLIENPEIVRMFVYSRTTAGNAEAVASLRACAARLEQLADSVETIQKERKW